MRVFFALPLPNTMPLTIDQWRQQVLAQDLAAPARPVAAANFHITLAFLGAVTEQQLELLCQKVDDLIEQQSFLADSLHVNQTGYWPKPGILWIGPSIWPDSLVRMASKLGNIGAVLGAKKDPRAYRPHITLIKHCILPIKPVIEPDFVLRYDQLTLFESIQMKAGVSYHPVQEWPLATVKQSSGARPVRKQRSRSLTVDSRHARGDSGQ